MSKRRVMVTGAAGVLGKAVCAHFDALGDHIIALDYSDERLQATFGDEPEYECLAVDLTDRDACAKVIGPVAGDGIDVLCNIAGGFLMGEAVHETSDDTWNFLMELNARSILNTSAVVVPVMLKAGGGKIVNVAARAATQGVANMGVYTASKAAVMRLTESMAQELREQGINVNCIMPSIIDTPRNREDMPSADFDKWVAPEQLAAVVGFLASDAASAVHGASIPVDGLS